MASECPSSTAEHCRSDRLCKRTPPWHPRQALMSVVSVSLVVCRCVEGALRKGRGAYVLCADRHGLLACAHRDTRQR
eukprot:921730-Rhodomonas_salina.1